jgi:hypothetical protein
MLLRRARLGIAVLLLGLVAGCGGGSRDLTEAEAAWCQDPANTEALEVALVSLTGVNLRTPDTDEEAAALEAEGWIKIWTVELTSGTRHRYLSSQEDYNRVCTAAYEER